MTRAMVFLREDQRFSPAPAEPNHSQPVERQLETGAVGRYKSKSQAAMLLYNNLGRMDYAAALGLQARLVARKQSAPSDDVVLLVEHPHVYTLGRGGNQANVLAPGKVPVYRTGRGGDVTYHGPGQLVVYPIIDLRSKLRKDVHRYVRNLELSAIRTLMDFGLAATRRPPYTGIWIGDKKIAAIGIAVRRCITFHGLALNVNPDLAYFRRIVPCGLAWADVTSMKKELGAEQNLSKVRERFLLNFAEIFGYSETAASVETRKIDAKGSAATSLIKLETRDSELETAS